jgi:O-antigen/teichoic acid export membrane protein
MKNEILKKPAASRVRLHPFFRDLGLTAVTGGTVVVAGFLVISLFGRILGAVALSEYLLLRRVVSWLQSGAQLGLGVALPRYVAHAIDKPAFERQAYFLAALACGGILPLGLGIVFMGARSFSARWLFGSAQVAHLILPLSVMLLGLVAHACVYGYYQGCLAMGLANGLQLCNLALVPLAAVIAFFHTGSVGLIVSVMGVSMLFGAGLFALPIMRHSRGGRWLKFTRHAGELLRYGIARVPGDFGNGALVALGPVIASHYLPMGRVSYLLLGLSILTVVSASAAPLGLVLLSKASMMLAQNRLDEFRSRLSHLVAGVLELSTFACLQLLIFADVLVGLWVGPKFLEGLPVIRILLLAIPFYMFYVALRSVIDAASVTAYNARNILVSLALFLTLAAVGAKAAPPKFLLEGLAGALVLAFITLAWLTARSVRQLYDLRIAWRHSAAALLIGALLAGVSLLIRFGQGFRMGPVELVMLELVQGVVFLGLLKKLGSTWLLFVWNTTFQRRVPADVLECEDLTNKANEGV